MLQINEDRVPSVINWASKRDKIDSPDPWSPANWKNIQLNLSAQIFIISEKTQYFGLALYFVDEISQQAHLVKIFVCGEMQGQGLGNFLLQQSLNILKDRAIKSTMLEVAQSNLIAVNVYLKNDFKTVVSVKDFYGTGRHAYRMLRLL